jgi:thiamine kinase-like enzyme
MGFLVMEYVNGVSLESVNIQDKPNIARRTIKAIQHLATIPMPQQGPGPVGGASPCGYLWSDDGARRTFSSAEDMDKWMNTRLEVVSEPPISLAYHPLRMCHMDLVRRNILLLPNSSLCFVDWAFAGFFPSLLEAYNFRELFYSDRDWFQQLLDLWPKDDDCDEQNLRSLGIIASVNMRNS